MTRNIIRKFILLIFCFVFLFIFINKVLAEEKTVNFADFSKNEIMLFEENYLVVGNAENDFNSIKYLADNYCFNKLGDNYISASIQISTNVAYAYCLMIDELHQFNLTDTERSCLNRFELSLNILYDRDCKTINIDFGSILTEVKIYREKINILRSNAFIYEILDENLSKKISIFETKTLMSKQTLGLKQELAKVQNPLKEKIDTAIRNKNIKLCKLYEFVEGSELYFRCILSLMKDHLKPGE